jgi:hypothetical protein
MDSLSSGHLPILLDLGDEEGLLRTYTRTFTDWAQFSEALGITFSTFSALLSTPAYLMLLLLNRGRFDHGVSHRHDNL